MRGGGGGASRVPGARGTRGGSGARRREVARLGGLKRRRGCGGRMSRRGRGRGGERRGGEERAGGGSTDGMRWERL